MAKLFATNPIRGGGGAVSLPQREQMPHARKRRRKREPGDEREEAPDAADEPERPPPEESSQDDSECVDPPPPRVDIHVAPDAASRSEHFESKRSDLILQTGRQRSVRWAESVPPATIECWARELLVPSDRWTGEEREDQVGDSLYVASSGAAARLQQLDIVANNLANADTIGFRSDRALFESTLDQAWMTEDGEPVPGAAALSEVRTTGLRATHQPGSISRTGAPLDVAILGEGFFPVQLLDGAVGYTRAGSFRVDAEGTLVTQAGFPLLSGATPISVGNASVRIQGDGSVVDDSGNTLGRLSLIGFDDPGQLAKQGRSVYRAPDGLEGNELDVSLVTQSVEQSNVEPVQELATLVILQRAFDASMQTLETSDELSQQLIREVSQ